MRWRTLKQLDDTEGTVRLHTGNGRSHQLGDGDLVLFPPFSEDPNDPLRWPKWRKYLAFGNMCILAFLSNVAAAGIYPAFVQISIEFNTGYAKVTTLSSYLILILGCSNFVWVPLAVYFGKRPIFLVSSVMMVASTAWAAVATSFESLLAATALTAIGAGSTEAIGAAIVNVSIGWRWVKGIISILSGINFLMILFGVPETRFERYLTQADNNGDRLNETANMPDSTEKSMATEVEEPREVESAAPPTSSTVPPKKSNWQLLALYDGVPKDVNLIELFLRPIPTIAYPAVIWATLAYSVALATSVMASIVSPAVLQAPPYNWSAGTNGLINIPSLIGNIIGAFLGGWCTDWVADKWSVRNGGIFDPEVRLSMVTVPLILTTIGTALFGVGLADTWSWPGLFISFGLISVALTSISSICMTYVLDAYFPAAPEALLLVNALKNIITFGFLYAIFPWITAVGYKAVSLESNVLQIERVTNHTSVFLQALGSMAAIYFVVIAFAYVLMFYGKRIRHHTSTKWRIIIW
ncbi:hypothetical protein H2200_002913 [Cladophialophora chaetospira]|uniref:MFS general substrate transporter n=1 Tax=Cladophialophora chaetospira TaxID=386627 RepID=A0AA38XGI1_9EURO|nr:hypothetical protein H2200_002913 [Cladophialophora chaetospira]